MASCNSTNLFIIRRGELWTSNGAWSFRGIPQAVVRDAWRTDGRAALDKVLTIAEAHSADEAFVTGTLGGVTLVTQIGGRPIGSGAPCPLTAFAHTLDLKAVASA